jgi:uncharacterized protein YllA (UPF0747 family)
MLVLRNSFLLVEKKERELVKKLELNILEFFQPELALADIIVKRETEHQLSLANELSELGELYTRLQNTASTIDSTLKDHVSNLQKKAEKTITALEKKMLRAEKRKFEAQLRQIKTVQSSLFPNNSLQERVDNLAPYFATYGPNLIDSILDASQPLEQQFCIVEL